MLRGWLSLPRSHARKTCTCWVVRSSSLSAGLEPPVHQGQVEGVGLKRVDRKAANAEPFEERVASRPFTTASEHHVDDPARFLHPRVRLVGQ
jgi:hypothetical protein